MVFTQDFKKEALTEIFRWGTMHSAPLKKVMHDVFTAEVDKMLPAAIEKSIEPFYEEMYLLKERINLLEKQLKEERLKWKKKN